MVCKQLYTAEICAYICSDLWMHAMTTMRCTKTMVSETHASVAHVKIRPRRNKVSF